MDNANNFYSFPKHGCAKLNGAYTLLLPINRLFAECFELDKMNVALKLPPKQLRRMYYFKPYLLKVIYLLYELNNSEILFIEERPKVGEVFKVTQYHRMQQFLPIMIDVYFFYMRSIADLFTELVNPKVFTSPDSGICKYKTLLRLAKGELSEKDYEYKFEPEDLFKSIRENSYWYEVLVTKEKGLYYRDLVSHNLYNTSVYVEEETEKIVLQIESQDKKVYPHIYIFDLIQSMMISFFNMLSTLPKEIWFTQQYTKQDYPIDYKKAPSYMEAIRRFIPEIEPKQE